MPTPVPPKILVVDDQPINVQLLKRKLEREGMAVLTAENGHQCLDIVSREIPDLILLDVMMPDMDGVAVCEALKASEATKAIPVIFITARNSKEGKLEGLSVGAVDYITKPIDLDETMARIQTQLKFQAVNRENVELQRRLGESRRSAAIGAITQGIAHNLNNLLGVVMGYLDLVKTHYDKPEIGKKNLGKLEEAVDRMVAIIRQLSSVSIRIRPHVTTTNLNALLQSSVERFKNDYRVPAEIAIDNRAGNIVFKTNVEMFEDMMGKLLINAWESYGPEASAASPILVEAEQKTIKGLPHVQFFVSDSGSGITVEMKDHAFEPFISSKSTVGVGMGLTVVRHAIRNLGGEIELQPRDSGGTRATFTLPIQE